MPFLPMTQKELRAAGHEICDIAIITGDAYVDHPSFGTAIISRVLEAAGFSVGIISQPQSDVDFSEFGRPRLGFFINSGNLDSMVAHYTAAKRRRSEDSYTAGGKSGARPDRALLVYCAAARRLFGDVPIAIGGLEASLRRFAHYDYWDDDVRQSALIESGADLLMYGMGERACVEIARRLANGEPIGDINDIKGTCFAIDTHDYTPRPCAECPSFELVKEATDSGKRQYAIACRIQQQEHDAVRGKTVIQRHGTKIVVQNPPQPPLDGVELDAIYELPYMREWNPRYNALGGVPALEEVKFSLVHNRGCFGACNFCALAYHQGRAVTSRTSDSVIREAQTLISLPGWKGYIHDVGGPTANFTKPSCEKQREQGLCRDRRCLSPEMCPSVKPDHTEYVELLRRLRTMPGVKKVFVRSGVRFDYLIEDPDETCFRELVKYHVSGQLKVAPEHCCDSVLALMGKPHYDVYLKFKKRFYELTQAAGKEQYLVPYMISSHPGSTLRDAIELAICLKRDKLRPEQVQDFYPTPGTISTAMFYTGIDPMSMDKVFVPRAPEDKKWQRALLQYYKRENAPTIRAALRAAGRIDLIGPGIECLVPDAQASYHGSGQAHAQGERKPRKGNPAQHKNNDSKGSYRKKSTEGRSGGYKGDSPAKSVVYKSDSPAKSGGYKGGSASQSGGYKSDSPAKSGGYKGGSASQSGGYKSDSPAKSGGYKGGSASQSGGYKSDSPAKSGGYKGGSASQSGGYKSDSPAKSGGYKGGSASQSGGYKSDSPAKSGGYKGGSAAKSGGYKGGAGKGQTGGYKKAVSGKKNGNGGR
ncbi:MAG: YgiQ family radical SAM protein [Oscillospiraceae bacterium]